MSIGLRSLTKAVGRLQRGQRIGGVLHQVQSGLRCSVRDHHRATTRHRHGGDVRRIRHHPGIAGGDQVDQLVHRVRAQHPVLGEEIVDQAVLDVHGRGVPRRRLPAEGRGPDLERHDRLARPARKLQRLEQLQPAARVLHVDGDGPGRGIAGEPGDGVGHVDVGLVPGGDPVGHSQAAVAQLGEHLNPHRTRLACDRYAAHVGPAVAVVVLRRRGEARHEPGRRARLPPCSSARPCACRGRERWPAARPGAPARRRRLRRTGRRR